MGIHDTDRKVGKKTLTIQKQELQVQFRIINRDFFAGVLPEAFFFANRKLEGSTPIRWYLWNSPTNPDRKRASIEFSYDDIMTEDGQHVVINDLKRELVLHWKYFTGKPIVRDQEYWKKALEIGWNPYAFTYGLPKDEYGGDLEDFKKVEGWQEKAKAFGFEQ